MTPKDIHGDPILATLRELPTYDLRADRAERLRTRCHSGLTMHDSSRQSPQGRETGVWPRAVRVVAGAWCVLYLVETIRRAAAVYGF
jgi:hypothetical protein